MASAVAARGMLPSSRKRTETTRRWRAATEPIGPHATAKTQVTAQEEEARILGAAPGSPLLHIRETTYDAQQTPIEYSVSLLRGDRYSASVVSIRKK